MTTQPSRTLETFPNPKPDADYTVRMTIPEFTCLCPKTGQPDFATLELEYVPDQRCVELKSLKLYIWSFRDRGAFHEAVTNEIADALAGFTGPPMRLEVVHTDALTVINDAYNASPDSTKAALQTLAILGRETGRRTVAVLGEMAELGKFAAEQHDAIGRIVVRLNIDQLFVVGDNAKLIHMGASQEGSWDGESKFFDSIDAALEAVREMLVPGDIVLVKSSKSANLRHLGDALMGAK